ncbi:MAG: hypothetical protein E6J79_08200 [Deltaproteobacteria bacterium]|nr:MAG: hypothetical protein E6J79_08200 [Deltaproteobacteria bacterium]
MGSAGTCHVVPLGGLLPGTRYYYRLRTNGTVVQDTGPSGPYFTTLRTPLDPSDLFFTVVGDWGGATSQEQNVASLQDAADPQITVSVGDNAYEFGTQSEWDSNALPYYQNNFRRIPFFPALGNHDLYSVGNPNWASSAEIKMFLLPRNGTQPERFSATRTSPCSTATAAATPRSSAGSPTTSRRPRASGSSPSSTTRRTRVRAASSPTAATSRSGPAGARCSSNTASTSSSTATTTSTSGRGTSTTFTSTAPEAATASARTT